LPAQAISIPRRAKEVSALVSAVIAKLEKDKAVLALDKDADRMHCEAFALRVFANADRNDRAGRRDLGTAKAFYAASCFLDVRGTRMIFVCSMHCTGHTQLQHHTVYTSRACRF
jgi:hypothetical protein